MGGVDGVVKPQKTPCFLTKKVLHCSMDNLGYMTEPTDSLESLPFNKGQYYELKRLQERHKELLRLLATGMAKKDIASTLGITYAMIQYVENSVLGQDYLEYIRGEREEVAIDIQGRIDELAGPAVNVIRQAIAGKMEIEVEDPETGKPKSIQIPVKPTEQIKAAQDVLSRHSKGYSPRQRVTNEHTGEVTHNLGSMIEEVKRRSKQMNGHNVSDAEIVETKEIESAETPTSD